MGQDCMVTSQCLITGIPCTLGNPRQFFFTFPWSTQSSVQGHHVTSPLLTSAPSLSVDDLTLYSLRKQAGSHLKMSHLLPLLAPHLLLSLHSACRSQRRSVPCTSIPRCLCRNFSPLVLKLDWDAILLV